MAELFAPHASKYPPPLDLGNLILLDRDMFNSGAEKLRGNMGFFVFAHSWLSLRVDNFMDFCGIELFLDHVPSKKAENPVARRDLDGERDKNI